MAVDKLADPGCRRKLIAEVLCDPQLLVTRDLDCLELFAGVGSVAKAAAELGHNSATFDKADNESHDICTTDGLHRAVHFLMRIKEGGLLWAAPVCRSWGWMNSCKCKRTQEDDFMGDLSYAPVQEGNCMANATAFLMELAHHRGVRVALENSSGSKIFKYKPVAELCATLGMHTVTTNRCAFDDAARGKRLLKPFQLLAAGCSVSRRGVSGSLCQDDRQTTRSKCVKIRTRFVYCFVVPCFVHFALCFLQRRTGPFLCFFFAGPRISIQLWASRVPGQ